MGSRRIIVVAPETHHPTIAGVLAEVAELEQFATLDTLPELPRCPVIVVLPRTELAAAVEVMQGSARVTAVVSGDAIESGELLQLATRLQGDHVPGVAKLMTTGTVVQATIVNDAADKETCLRSIAEFIDRMRVPAALRARIEQCLDEMLMNALYDAPVDAHGNHVFAGVPTRRRITMRTQHGARVEYAADGTRIAISVRDAFGSLARETLVRHLHKSLHREQAVDRKAGGAGLGLYLMASEASGLYFDVVPGVATEVACVFTLDHRDRRELAFVVHEAQGQTKSAPARRLLSARTRRIRIAGAVGVIAFAVGTVVAVRLLYRPTTAPVLITTTKGATIDVEGRRVGIARDGRLVIDGLEIGRTYRVIARLERYETGRALVTPAEGDNQVMLELQSVATVVLDTQPSDATVSIDGKRIGSTPIEIPWLSPGTHVEATFVRTGYASTTLRIEVPARGQVRRVMQALAPSDRVARIRFVSNPTGAAIVRDGELSRTNRTYTPAEIIVEAEQPQRFTLVMPNYQPLVIEPFTPARGSDVEKVGNLVASPRRSSP
jgi:hypothetical protein